MSNAIVTRIFKISNQIAASFIPNQVENFGTNSPAGMFPTYLRAQVRGISARWWMIHTSTIVGSRILEESSFDSGQSHPHRRFPFFCLSKFLICEMRNPTVASKFQPSCKFTYRTRSRILGLIQHMDSNIFDAKVRVLSARWWMVHVRTVFIFKSAISGGVACSTRARAMTTWVADFLVLKHK